MSGAHRAARAVERHKQSRISFTSLKSPEQRSSNSLKHQGKLLVFVFFWPYVLYDCACVVVIYIFSFMYFFCTYVAGVAVLFVSTACERASKNIYHFLTLSISVFVP